MNLTTDSYIQSEKKKQPALLGAIKTYTRKGDSKKKSMNRCNSLGN